MLEQWASTNKDYPYDQTTIGEFEFVARENPHNIALICGEKEMTYAALNAKADIVAKTLLFHGAKPNDLIAIMIERSIDMVIGLLGIWKAGAGYVPLNPEDPDNRLAHILQETQCVLMLTKKRFNKKIVATFFTGKIIAMDDDRSIRHNAIKNIDLSQVQPENIAYVLYTSGSTGQPKGVVVEHRGLWEYLWACQEWAKLKPNNRFLQLSPYIFDASLFDLYLPLISLVTVVLPERENNYDLPYLARLIAEKKIHYLKSVPSFLRLFSQELKQKSCKSLQAIYSVGEELFPIDVERLHRSTGACIYNQYGPTESIGIVSVAHCLPDEKEVTLGHPISNIRLFILDDQLKPIPQGEYGELYISKRYLAKGYLKQDALTAKCFIPNPFLQSEDKLLGHYLYLYKSGDRARQLPDGRLQFGGRIDFQVKINGKRVELGEIETVIANHVAVQSIVVLKIEEQLIAFVVFNKIIDIQILQAHVAEYLPSFMRPARWIILTSLPLTPSGKTNRQDLLALTKTEMSDDEVLSMTIPSEWNYLYEHIVNLLKKLLPSSAICLLSLKKNFFELGLSSLNFIEFSQTLRQLFNISLSVQDLFYHHTLLKLIPHILILLQGKKVDNFIVPLSEKGSQLPLFILPGGFGEGNEILPFMLMLSHYSFDRPLYAIRSRVNDCDWKIPRTLHEQACAIFREIKKIQSDGPYYFLGECIASPMALELTKIAEQQKEPLGVVILLDSSPYFRETFPFSRYMNQFSVCKRERLIRAQRMRALNLPARVVEYYHLLMAWKPKRLQTPISFIFSSDMNEVDNVLKRWKIFFKTMPKFNIVSGTHDTYIRQQSAETASVINDILLTYTTRGHNLRF